MKKNSCKLEWGNRIENLFNIFQLTFLLELLSLFENLTKKEQHLYEFYLSPRVRCHKNFHQIV